MKPPKRIIAAIIQLLSIAVPVLAGPLEDGLAAYKRGDHAAAMRILRPLAEQGDSMAETTVGNMYYFNFGDMPLDWLSAYMWYSLATAHGNKLAAFMLTQMIPKMTQKEIAEGDRRFREWIAQHGNQDMRLP
jgi:TPR repeat protein